MPKVVQPMKAHRAFFCDKCGTVPPDSKFGGHRGHFVLLHRLPSGTFGVKFKSKKGLKNGIPDWTFLRITDRVPKECAAVCYDCLLGNNDMQNKLLAKDGLAQVAVESEPVGVQIAEASNEEA